MGPFLTVAEDLSSFPSYSSATDPVTGTIYASQYDIFTVGAGYLDVWAALNNSDTLPAGNSAQSPTAQYDSLTGKVKVVFGTNLVWGDSLVWGANLVWGSSVLVSGTSPVSGDSLAWGSSATQGFNIVWGDSLVWSNATQTLAESLGISINGEN